ncbi:MAG: HEAT repeat protein [Candidatus Paceibacteria bacterium]|jgi:HEAT repeat protein
MRPNTGPSTPSGVSIPDLSDWTWWWNYNRDPYLDIKRHVLGGGTVTGSDDFFLGHGQAAEASSLSPGDEDIRKIIGPALQRAVESGSWKVQSDAMMAIAKLHPVFKPEGKTMIELISQHLSAPNQKMAESAIVALGIMGDLSCIRILADIAADNPAGRKWMGRESVPGRTRPLAALAMGILGPRMNNQDASRSLVGRLAAILRGEEGATPDLHVACITSIGQTPLPEAGIPNDRKVDRGEFLTASLEAQISHLLGILQDKKRHEYVRAHTPKAVATLVAGASKALRNEVKDSLLVELERHKRSDRLVRYGIIEALGMLGDADEDRVDKQLRAALHESVSNGDNNQRGLSLISLALASGRAGDGEDPYAALAKERKYLLKQLSNGKSRLRTWTALALGLQDYHAAAGGQPHSKAVADALLQSFKSTSSPADSGAYSIAVGLTGNAKARDELIDRLQRKGDDNAKGFAAIGLGLSRAADARPELEAIIAESKFHPIPLRKASVALALLDDKTIVATLFDALENGKSAAVKSAIIAGIGLVGDKRVVEPLVSMLDDPEELEITRSFSSIALGVVCETERLPWTAAFANHVNYFAMTETLLTGKGTGLLNLR